MTDRRLTLWLTAVLTACAGALLLVHGLERFGGYAPCELCLRQREVYWIAGAVALAALALERGVPVAAPVGVVAVGVAFAVGFAVAGYHAGVEWGWWPGPAACTGRGGGAIHAADVAAIFSSRAPVLVVRCDEAALRVVGLSLSGWNALASAALSLASFALVLPRRRRL